MFSTVKQNDKSNVMGSDFNLKAVVLYASMFDYVLENRGNRVFRTRSV